MKLLKPNLIYNTFIVRQLSTQQSKVLLESNHNGISYLTLNNPSKRNALSLGVIEDLIKCIHSANDSRCLVIKSTGNVFSSGHDLKELHSSDANQQETIFRRVNDLMLMIARNKVPVIASVDGLATAAGCQLVAACHMAICSENSRFATPGVNIGLFCSTPSVQLSRAVNKKLAMDMLLTGEPISAEAALQGGLVSRIYKSKDLNSETDRIANIIASKSSPVVRLGIQNFNRQIRSSLEEAAAMSASTMVHNLELGDGKEGLAAFLEKRHPNWNKD